MTKTDERRVASAHGWLVRAADDLLHAESQIETVSASQDSYTCYFAQQAAEKAMKSVLVICGEECPNTHDLVNLHQRLPNDDAWADLLVDGADLESLSMWTMTARYGMDDDVLTYATKEEAREALHCAQGIVYGVWQGMAAKGHPLPPERLTAPLHAPSDSECAIDPDDTKGPNGP